MHGFDFYLSSPQTFLFDGKNYISWYCTSYNIILKWRLCNNGYLTSNMNVLECHLCFENENNSKHVKICNASLYTKKQRTAFGTYSI